MNPFIRPRFVGRGGEQGELTQLGRELLRARQGAARTVVVDGAPGVGKSRLLDEFHNLALSAGCLSVHLSLRDRPTPTRLLQGIASGIAGDSSRTPQPSETEGLLREVFARGAQGAAAGTIAVATALGLAPAAAPSLAVWLAAGHVAIPLLTTALTRLGDTDAADDTTEPEGLAEIAEALAQVNQHLNKANGAPALVLTFDQWDHARHGTRRRLEAFENVAGTLHEHLCEWEPRRVLLVFGVRTEDRAETIAEVHNAINTRSLLVRPLGPGPSCDLLMQPTEGEGALLAFDTEAAGLCHEQCRGNPETMAFLAAGIWEAACERGAGVITAGFYQAHAPAQIEQLVSTRVERFLRAHHEDDQQAKSALLSLAQKGPDYRWTPSELQETTGRGLSFQQAARFLEELSAASLGLLSYRVGQATESSYYEFGHELRWHGLRQWAHPTEGARERETWLAVARLTELLATGSAQLLPSVRATIYYELRRLGSPEAISVLQEAHAVEDPRLTGVLGDMLRNPFPGT